jgi:hypothetical protein
MLGSAVTPKQKDFANVFQDEIDPRDQLADVSMSVMTKGQNYLLSKVVNSISVK